MKQEQMTQQEFAQALEISPASLSNIFNGKTNPTNNHVRAIHTHFPNINIDWLMFGEGNMYTTQPTQNSNAKQGNIEHQSPTSQDTQALPHDASSPIQPPTTQTLSYNTTQTNKEKSDTPIREIIKYIDKPQRKIIEIKVFFDDGTFETYNWNKTNKKTSPRTLVNNKKHYLYHYQPQQNHAKNDS